MYGATPGSFKKFEAAQLAAEAFQKEEEKIWIVMFKKVTNQVWYKPVCQSDIDEATKDGYYICSDEMNMIKSL